jgi:uncharacterized repeat protein (TIGR01451 family)
LIVKGGEKVQKNIPKGLLMITLTFLFTLTIAGAAFAATGDQVTNAIVTPSTLPLVNSNSTQGGNDQFVVNTTPAQGFPTNGSSYANINTGNNDESSANLTLNLTIPQGAKTLSFDWRFATNEYPDYNVPDWAKVEIVDGNSVTNILLLPNGKTVDVQNAWNYLSSTNPNNIGYNGITPMYTTSTDISAYAGKNILLVFSIADAQDKFYRSALFIDNLNIQPVRTSLVVGAVSGFNGNSVPITATLTSNGNPVVGRTVSFTVNGGGAGTAVTNGVGVASVNYLISNMNAGGYPIVETFAQDGQYLGSTGSNTLTVIPTANVTIAKTGNGPVNVGQTGTFTITLHNNGLDAAHNVVVTDVLPDGFSFGTPSQGSISGNVWNVGTLACGDSATVTVSGLITSDMAGTTIDNEATETQDEFTQESQTACGSIVVNPMANVTITKAGNGPLNVGQTGIFTINLTNNGPNAAHNVVVTDVLPDGFSFGTPSQGSISGNVWNVGTLACGDSATVTVSGLITSDMAGTTIDNEATETQDEFTQESQIACASIYVPSADLVLTKTVDKTKPVVKDVVVFTLIVNNHGPDTSVGVQVADKLPQGLTFVKYAASTGTYDPATGIWTIGDLKNGETAWINITSTVDQVGNITNNASVTSMTYDPNIEGSSASASIDAQHSQSVGGGVTPGNDSSNYSSVGAETVAMQKTGVPIGMILTALLMLVTGLVMPRRK